MHLNQLYVLACLFSSFLARGWIILWLAERWGGSWLLKFSFKIMFPFSSIACVDQNYDSYHGICYCYLELVCLACVTETFNIRPSSYSHYLWGVFCFSLVFFWWWWWVFFELYCYLYIIYSYIAIYLLPWFVCFASTGRTSQIIKRNACDKSWSMRTQ